MKARCLIIMCLVTMSCQIGENGNPTEFSDFKPAQNAPIDRVAIKVDQEIEAIWVLLDVEGKGHIPLKQLRKLIPGRSEKAMDMCLQNNPHLFSDQNKIIFKDRYSKCMHDIFHFPQLEALRESLEKAHSKMLTQERKTKKRKPDHEKEFDLNEVPGVNPIEEGKAQIFK